MYICLAQKEAKYSYTFNIIILYQADAAVQHKLNVQRHAQKTQKISGA